MTDITIPAQSRAAGANSAKSSTAETFEGFAVEVFIAMLKNWPEVAVQGARRHFRDGPQIILPLPKENTNAE